MPNQNVATFRHLHHNTSPLLLPNAWDAVSARMFEQAGASAIATTSAGMAWGLGYQDGRCLPVSEVLAFASRIVRVLKVPLSIDIENGYADDPRAVADLAQRLADIGIAGINIEDGRDEPQLLAAKIGAIREQIGKTGADLFINARCDVFLAELASADQRVAEAVRRGKQYAEAGADGLFLPALHKNEEIRAVVADIALPLNLMAWPNLADAAGLAGLGVRRLSAGSGLAQLVWGVAEHAAKDFLATGASAAPQGLSVKPFAEMQSLFR